MSACGDQLVDNLIQAMVGAWRGRKDTTPWKTKLLMAYITKLDGSSGRVLDLKHHQRESFRQPTNKHLLRTAADARKELGSYLKRLERAAGKVDLGK